MAAYAAIILTASIRTRTLVPDCVCLALAIQQANSMPRIIFSSVVCLAVSHFSQYLVKGTIVGKIMQH